MITMAIYTLKIDSLTKYSGLRCLEHFECREDAVKSLKECAERFLDRNPGDWEREESEDTITLRLELGFFDGSVRETDIIPRGGKIIAESGTVVRCNENNDIYAKLGETVTSQSTGVTFSHIINMRERRRIRPEEYVNGFTWTGIGGTEEFHKTLNDIFDAEFKAQYDN